MPTIEDVGADVGAEGEPSRLDRHDEEEDDDDIDETLFERLVGLREMFPDFLRNGTHTTITSSWALTQWLYAKSRTVLWVVGSSATILALPAILETERQQVLDMEAQQQREILLGPTAAASAKGAGMMPQPMMPMAPAAAS